MTANPKITDNIKSHVTLSILNPYTSAVLWSETLVVICCSIDVTRRTYRPKITRVNVWINVWGEKHTWQCAIHVLQQLLSHTLIQYLLTSVHIKQVVHTLADRSRHVKSVWEYTVKTLWTSAASSIPRTAVSSSNTCIQLIPLKGRSSNYLTADIPAEI